MHQTKVTLAKFRGTKEQLLQPQYSHLENGHSFMMIIGYSRVEETVYKRKSEKVGEEVLGRC